MTVSWTKRYQAPSVLASYPQWLHFPAAQNCWNLRLLWLLTMLAISCCPEWSDPEYFTLESTQFILHTSMANISGICTIYYPWPYISRSTHTYLNKELSRNYFAFFCNMIVFGMNLTATWIWNVRKSFSIGRNYRDKCTPALLEFCSLYWKKKHSNDQQVTKQCPRKQLYCALWKMSKRLYKIGIGENVRELSTKLNHLNPPIFIHDQENHICIQI